MKITLETHRMPRKQQRLEFDQIRKILAFAYLINGLQPTADSSIGFYGAHSGNIFFSLDLEKQFPDKIGTEKEHVEAARLLAANGLYSLRFEAERHDFTEIFRSLVEKPYTDSLTLFAEKDLQFFFQDPIAWLFTLGRDLPQIKDSTESCLQTPTITQEDFNFRWEQYQWIKGNFPLPETRPNYAKEIQNYPMENIEERIEIEKLAFRLTQLSILFTALHLESVRSRFDFPPIDLCNIELILPERRNILSAREQRLDRDTYATKLASENGLTDFEKELSLIRHFLWGIFRLANTRRTRADSHLFDCLQQLQVSLPTDPSFYDFTNGETGRLFRDARHLAGDLMEQKLKESFNRTHPNLGKMLFEDVPPLNDSIAMLPERSEFPR